MLIEWRWLEAGGGDSGGGWDGRERFNVYAEMSRRGGGSAFDAYGYGASLCGVEGGCGVSVWARVHVMLRGFMAAQVAAAERLRADGSEGGDAVCGGGGTGFGGGGGGK